jgi:hypothetical protein
VDAARHFSNPPHNFTFSVIFSFFSSSFCPANPLRKKEKKRRDDDITFCQTVFCVFNELSSLSSPLSLSPKFFTCVNAVHRYTDTVTAPARQDEIEEERG